MAVWVDVVNLVILLVASAILYVYLRRKQDEQRRLEDELARDPAPRPDRALDEYSNLIGQTTLELRAAARTLERTRATMRRGIK